MGLKDEIARCPETHRAALDYAAARKQIELARCRGLTGQMETWGMTSARARERYLEAREREQSTLELGDYR